MSPNVLNPHYSLSRKQYIEYEKLNIRIDASQNVLNPHYSSHLIIHIKIEILFVLNQSLLAF